MDGPFDGIKVLVLVLLTMFTLFGGALLLAGALVWLGQKVAKLTGLRL